MDPRRLIVSCGPHAKFDHKRWLVISFDSPAPPVLAHGIGGTSVSHHWLEGPPGSLPLDDGPALPPAIPVRKER